MTTHRQHDSNYRKFLKFWERFAASFAFPFSANGALSEFVTNPNVTGAYAEAWVRWAARSMLPHFRVSTGAIIGAMDSARDGSLASVPQLDLIIWDPTELPALFEQGEFALVHVHAARGIVEVKRSLKDKADTLKQLKLQQRRLFHELRGNILGVVVEHDEPLFKGQVRSGWPAAKGRGPEPALTRLLDSNTHRPDPMGIFAFIYFLSHVAAAEPPRTAA